MGSEIYHAIHTSHERKTLQDFCSNFWLPVRAKTIIEGPNSIYTVFAENFDKFNALFLLRQMRASTDQIKFFTARRILPCLHFGIIKSICKIFSYTMQENQILCRNALFPSREGSNLARIPSKWICDCHTKVDSLCSFKNPSTKRRLPSLARKLFGERKLGS